MSLRRSILALALAATLAGCAGNGIDNLPDAPAGTSLADRFTALLDKRCPMPAEQLTKPN